MLVHNGTFGPAYALMQGDVDSWGTQEGPVALTCKKSVEGWWELNKTCLYWSMEGSLACSTSWLNICRYWWVKAWLHRIMQIQGLQQIIIRRNSIWVWFQLSSSRWGFGLSKQETEGQLHERLHFQLRPLQFQPHLHNHHKAEFS